MPKKVFKRILALSLSLALMLLCFCSCKKEGEKYTTIALSEVTPFAADLKIDTIFFVP